MLEAVIEAAIADGSAESLTRKSDGTCRRAYGILTT